ncbi:helix-turn-helix domain-containing protein [Phenylobacterium sp. J367]|uniref:helix-turn-helix domain-containing protein n=1 Tax=Phenylobacterium sp. J367 TaxID=2898435 RepID=UPI0021513D65|nr:helix-turn-helix transcriptional regulator [Phenylobacterium sp. J367]MCR5879530.1 helix-turn-helix domain-containing protein [Phenylobacterium sp. J367]
MKLRRILARNVIRRRNAVGLSQEALADRAGVDRTWLSKLETAKAAVSIDVIEKVARGLDVEPALLLSGE